MIAEEYARLFGVALPDYLDGLDTANLGPGGPRTLAVCAYVAWCDAGRRHWRLHVTRGALAAAQAGDTARQAQRDYGTARRAWDAVAEPVAVPVAPKRPATKPQPRRYDFMADLDAAMAVG